MCVSGVNTPSGRAGVPKGREVCAGRAAGGAGVDSHPCVFWNLPREATGGNSLGKPLPAATARQATKWPVLYGGSVSEGLPRTLCEVTGTLSPWFN